MPEPKRNDRTDEQARKLTEAALLIVDARRKAVELVRESGAQLEEEERDFFEGCTALRPPPPDPHRCVCPRYRGSGGNDKCRTTFPDPWTGGWGGNPLVRCGHPKEAHGI
ncbi:DUF6422 family protein [Streptomyces sp. NPDC047976]|uniref:DUF6422 family protein n=1 Tax=unclassified Streptomyces TaxID=2593676 RepID=UPI003429EC33